MSTNKTKLIDNPNFAGILELLTFVVLIVAVVSRSLGHFLSAISEYEPNYAVLTRVVAYSALLILGTVCLSLIRNRSTSLLSVQRARISIFISISFIFLVGISFYSSTLPLLMVSIVYVLTFISYSGYFSIAKPFGTVISRGVVLILLVAAISLPVLSSKYINSESYPDLKILEESKSFIHLVSLIDDSSISFNLDEATFELVESNIEKLREVNLTTPSLFKIYKTEKLLRLSLNENALSSLCLMGSYDQKGYIDVVDCFYNMSFTKKYTKEQALSHISKINFKNSQIKNQVFYEVNRLFLFPQIQTKKYFSEAYELTQLMFIRGAYLHHYNSIVRTINDYESLKHYFTNQYGAGPLIISKLTSRLFNLSSFDGVWVSIVLINLLVLMILSIFCRYESNWEIIAFGYSISILVTYFISNLMAPFLYYIRFFPTILMCLLLYLAVSKSIVLRKNLKFTLCFLGLALVIALYNFEYAILTFCGVLIAGLVTSEVFYILFGIISILAAIIFKFINTDATRIDTNYFAYFMGVSGNSSVHIMVVAFMLSVLLLLVLFYRRRLVKEIPFELVLLFSIFLTLCIKVVWIGAPNHIGPLFLISAFCYSLYVKSYESFSDSYDRNIKKAYISINFFIFILALIQWPLFSMNKEFGGVEYKYPSFSKFFKLSVNLEEKLKDFNSLYRQGDLVISPIDNALSLAVESSITKPYPDISTNVNSREDIRKIVNAYSGLQGGRVIVDKVVVNLNDFNVVQNSLARHGLSAENIYLGYFSEIQEMNLIYLSTLRKKHNICAESKYFIVLCD